MPLRPSNVFDTVVTPRPVRRVVSVTKSEGGENVQREHFRIVLMGTGGVGKSAIVDQFIYLRTPDSQKKRAAEMHHVQFSDCNQTLTVELLDTSGYEHFPAMRELAIRQAQAFILVSAVDQEASFEHVRQLREEILRVKQTAAHPPIVVVANKVDLPKKEWAFDTAYSELVVHCDWEDCGFVACSAHDHASIRGIFTELLAQARGVLGSDCHSLKPLQNVHRRGSMPSLLEVPTNLIKRTPSFPRKTKLSRHCPRTSGATSPRTQQPDCHVQ
ncbi:putative Ras-related protein O-Krev [Hypsibius exemplaris]|uniref:Ras-related protein O-Krev n=1 Tax=Hypsibius exemplaris TaxID=2072580 RepID=A0A1W0WS41_HYPEX|nr:putative Ras-related protein O-Krev [Hypsibius exemplaris]